MLCRSHVLCWQLRLRVAYATVSAQRNAFIASFKSDVSVCATTLLLAFSSLPSLIGICGGLLQTALGVTSSAVLSVSASQAAGTPASGADAYTLVYFCLASNVSASAVQQYGVTLAAQLNDPNSALLQVQ